MSAKRIVVLVVTRYENKSKMDAEVDGSADVFCVLSEAAENNVDPSFCQSSSVVGKEFDKACRGEVRAFPSTTAHKKSGGDGGFTCCVPGCFNNNKKNPELSFYNFPNGKSPESQELRKKWIHLISRKNFTPTLGHRVCSQHFPGGRKTYMNCLPILVPKTIKPTLTTPRSTTKARNRTSVCPEQNTKRRRLCEMEAQNVLVDCTKETYPEVENLDPSASLREQVEKLKAENNMLKSENVCQKNDIKVLKEQIHKVQIEKSFSVDRFKDDDKLFRFYTGLQDYKTFQILFESFGTVVNNIVYYDLNTKAENITSSDFVKHGPKRLLRPEQEFFLVLVRLRLGLHEEDIAARAGFSQSQVSRIMISWIDFLHARLRSYPIWPSRSCIDKTMPESFKQMYPSTRVVIDCTEIFIEMPSSFRSQSVTYSSYKHHNTAKALIGISPSGAVSFVSDLYAGRSSDKQITNDCGILDLLEAGDSVMADKGFEIAGDLPQGVTLNIPPFLGGKDHLSIEEETETRRIASVRIHVERAIARIKNFKILSTIFPVSMAADINKVWIICCYLSNFLPPLIKNDRA